MSESLYVKMRTLSMQMESTASMMFDLCDGDSVMLLHAKELQGAADMLQTWAIELEQDLIQ